MLELWRDGERMGTVLVLDGVVVKNTSNGNTIRDLLTVSEAENGKAVYVVSGFRTQAKQDAIRANDPTAARVSKHTTQIAADIFMPGYSSRETATAAHNAGVFNRISSYSGKNTAHVDYGEDGNQGLFHDWIHQEE